MRKRITRVSPVQLGKVFAILYALASVPIVLIMLLAGSSAGQGMPTWFALAIPVVYLVLGFIFTAIAAWLYNLVARWVGGVEYVTEEVEGA